MWLCNVEKEFMVSYTIHTYMSIYIHAYECIPCINEH